MNADYPLGQPRKEAVKKEKLVSVVASLPYHRFAVVDGGLFDDLPGMLRRYHLFARSLYLDQTDLEVQKAGPWLVALDQTREAAHQIMSLPHSKPAMVFWSCVYGEDLLYRHLRTLNMVRLPSWAAAGASEPPQNEVDEKELAFFRHWDPRALAALLPTLNAAQFSRILGPAVQIAFDAPDYGGVRRVVFDTAWPVAPSGILTLDSNQCEALIERRSMVSQQRIVCYLRSYAPEYVGKCNDEDLMHRVVAYSKQADAAGLKNEDAVGIWCYMQLTSKTDLSRDKEFMNFLNSRSDGQTADARLQQIFYVRLNALRGSNKQQ